VTELAFARIQTAVLFAFHILFAVAGMGMPLLMTLAEALHLRTGDPVWRTLAVRWSRGTAVLFAVGAVSGTALSFQLGLLWPRFMALAGAAVGLPFALEGFAFFAEAIFLGIYLYGWERVPPRAHLACGALVALGGALSGILVVTANAWMNSPAGFSLAGATPSDVDPAAAMFNPAWRTEVLHMTLAAYASVGFAAAGIHAWRLLRAPGERFDRAGLALALCVGGAAALLLPLSGDASARAAARRQPLKLAAMEGQFRTERRAPLRIGGLPDDTAERTPWALEIPGGLSLLAFHDLDAEVQGLSSAPREDRPFALPVHLAFQVMVACGTIMAAVALVAAAAAFKDRERLYRPRLLRAVAAAGPLGLAAVEAGWTVTELGRQPWAVYGVLRTRDAVTPAAGLAVPLGAIAATYLALGLFAARLLLREIAAGPGGTGTAPRAGADREGA